MNSTQAGVIEAILRLKDELTPVLRSTMNTVQSTMKNAAANIEKSFSSITPAFKRVLSDMNSAAKTAAMSLNNAFGSMMNSLHTGGERLKGLGAGIAKAGFGISAAVAPLALLGQQAISAAMQAVESENLFEVSFGNMAGAARQWSEETSKALGLNEYELRRTSGTLFVMMDSMGLAKDKSFEMSTSLTKLAADMASFYNLPVDVAFNKLRQGLVGETEGLRALGILVDENTVKQAAMSAGISNAGEKMTQQEKVLARYHAIMTQTAKAQGDLARTMDSPTNALRVMQEQFNQLQIKLGMALMPTIQTLIGYFRELTPTLAALIEWFTKLPREVQFAATAIGLLVVAAGPVLLTVGGLIASLGALLPMLPLIATAMTALAAAWALAAGNMNFSIKDLMKVLTTWMSFAIDVAKNVALGWEALKLSFTSVAFYITTKLKEIVDNAVSVLNVLAKIPGMLGDPARAGAAAGAQSSSSLGALAASFKDQFKGSIESQNQIIAKFEGMKKSGVAALTAVVTGAKDAATAVAGLADSIGGNGAAGGGGVAGAMAKAAQWTRVAGLEMTAYIEKGRELNHLNLKPGSNLPSQKFTGEFDLTAGPDAAFATSLRSTISAAFKSLPQVIMGALQGGGNVGQAIGGSLAGSIASNLGSKLAGKLGGTLGGALGSVIPGLGTMLGSLVGDKLGGFIGKLFGGGEGKKVNDLRDQYIAAAGGFDALAKSAGKAAPNLDLVKKLLDAKTVKQYEAAVRELDGAFAQQAAAQAALEEAVQRYGFSIEELGPKFRQQELDKQAAQLLQDYQLLIASGIENATVIEKMAPAMNEYINTARAAGSALPEAMRPQIEKMLEMGLIVGKNGEAFKTAEEAGISFTKTLSEGLQEAVNAINRLVEALTGVKSPGPITIPVNYERVGSPGEIPVDFPRQTELDGYATGTRGLRDFKSGTDVTLHGREAVMPENEYTALVRAAAASANGGVSSGVDSLVEAIYALASRPNQLVVNGSVLAESSARELEQLSPGGVRLETQLRRSRRGGRG